MGNLFAITFLAARERNGDSSWIVPLLVFAIWIVGSIFKAIGEARQSKQEDRQKDESGKQPRYKPLTNELESRTEKPRQPQIQQAQIGQEQTRQPKVRQTHQPQARVEPQPQARQAQPRQSQRKAARQSRPKPPKRTSGAASSFKSGMQATLEHAFAVQQEKVEKQPVKRVSTKSSSGHQFEKSRAKPQMKLKAKQGNMHAPKKKKFSELEKAAQPAQPVAKDFDGRSIIDSLQDQNSLKNAVIYAEILGKPKTFEGQ